MRAKEGKFKELVVPLIWIVGFQVVSAAIGIMTAPDVAGWYGLLTRPSFTPPNYIFPIVWPALYVLIALTGWRIFCLSEKSELRRLGGVFAVYMTLNWTWSFVFFSFHMIFMGLVWIILMDACAILLMVWAWRGDRQVTYLMLAPVAWTLFAAVLNGGYWLLNR